METCIALGLAASQDTAIGCAPLIKHSSVLLLM